VSAALADAGQGEEAARCGAMVYTTPAQDTLANCTKPPGHARSEDSAERAHAQTGRPGFSWYTVGQAPPGLCVDSHGRVFESGHFFSTNFTRCRICDAPRPKENTA
jgi:hypothetical protein